MANLVTRSANIRIVNEEKRVVCSVSNILPTVDAETALGFVNAIETIYNKGPCTARINVAIDIAP